MIQLVSVPSVRRAPDSVCFIHRTMQCLLHFVFINVTAAEVCPAKENFKWIFSLCSSPELRRLKQHRDTRVDSTVFIIKLDCGCTGLIFIHLYVLFLQIKTHKGLMAISEQGKNDASADWPTTLLLGRGARSLTGLPLLLTRC